jgi:hypothetical protein
MKCQNCNCQVSSEFTFAFTTNCCPKCGKTMMHEDVKTLYLKIEEVMKKSDNDLGDLAVWLVNNYKFKTTELVEDVVETSEMVQREETLPVETMTDTVTIDVEMTPLEPKVKKPAPIKTSREQKDQSMLSPERKNLFAKRAGVDKIKFETLVKDIQGNSMIDSSFDDNSVGDYESEDMSDFNDAPLSRHEIHTVASLFDIPDAGKTDFTEIQKIQKLEQLAVTGSVGKIRRSS